MQLTMAGPKAAHLDELWPLYAHVAGNICVPLLFPSLCSSTSASIEGLSYEEFDFPMPSST